MYKEKFNKGKREKWVLAAMSMVLSGILLLLIFPVVSVDASAEEPSADSVMTTSVNTNMATLVRSSIAVALSSKVDLDVTPKAQGAFSEGVANMKVTTNNTTGYAVYLQTADNSSELKATNPHIEASIGPVEGIMSAGSYTSNLNQWGYAVSDATSSSSLANIEYKAVPRAGDEAIIRTTGISREDDYDLSFAVAVGSDIPAGLYTNQLLVSVVANPIEVRSLNDINYMQDMTAEICAITFEGETKQLIDTRDGKSYWVAKLADGNCWMTQNLAFTITQEMIDNGSINSGNTDIAFTWGSEPAWTDVTSWEALGEKYTAQNYPGEYVGPTATYKTTGETDLVNVSYASAYSWDLGEVVQMWPSYHHRCTSYTCEGFINVSDGGWQSTFSAVQGDYTLKNGEAQNGIIAADEEGKTYDAHYLVGNTYQYNAVVAGTGGELEYKQAVGSICPKGWKLALGGGYTGSGSFVNLFNAYGLTGSLISNEEYSLIKEPLYIPRAGYMAISKANQKVGLDLVGSNGYIRSATAWMLSGSRGLDFQMTKGSDGDMSKGTGMTTRCLVR